MKKNKNKRQRNPPQTPLAAFHKGNRDAEIAAFGKMILHYKVIQSKKVYKRNRKIEID